MDKHPHDEVIRAWLDGKRVEYQPQPSGPWYAIFSLGDSQGRNVPAFSVRHKYRIAASVIDETDGG
jgi:hypothetical protein